MVFFYYLVIIILAFVFAHGIYQISHSSSVSAKLDKNLRLKKFISHLPMIVFLALIASPLYYEFPNTGFSRIATFEDDGSIKYHPYGMFSFESSGSYTNVPFKKIHVLVRENYHSSDESGTYSIVYSFDQRKKILEYEVIIYIINPEKFYRVKEHRIVPTYRLDWFKNPFKVWEAWEYTEKKNVYQAMASLGAQKLLEFNEENKKIIERYFNLSEDYQKKFGSMIEEWINPKLEKEGLKITFKEFRFV